MKRYLSWFIPVLCAAVFCGGAENSGQEKVKRIEWLQDNAQKYMSTKIYELRHVRASDITPFVEGAVKRYRTDSRVQRLSYSAGRQEFLIVSTGTAMLPYVDDIMKALDRPSGKVDAMGSNIEGTGISNFVYYTKYRTSEDMKRIINRNSLCRYRLRHDLLEKFRFQRSADSEVADGAGSSGPAGCVDVECL